MREKATVVVSIEAESTENKLGQLGSMGVWACLLYISPKTLFISTIGIISQKRTRKHQILEFKNETT